jgi:hypothetical protein
MPLSFDILRTDDLLVLSVDAINLKLDASRKDKPRLVVDDKTQPALLVFHFPAQHLSEQAFFQVDPNPPPPFNPPPDPPPQAQDDPLKLPGQVDWRLAGESRLVFRLPSGMDGLDYSVEALLDWTTLEPVLGAIAAVPDGSTPSTAPAIAEPGPQETALELPYRLALSPTALAGGDWAGWVHARSPVVRTGRTELWHTRLARAHRAKAGAPPTFTEVAQHSPLPVRAVWSPDFVTGQPLPPHSGDNVPFRPAMTPRDRDQIVILTSGFSGYLQKLQSGAEITYAPTPARASRLHLSAFGAWLTATAAWPDGVFYRYIERFHPPPGDSPPPASVRTAAEAVGPIHIPEVTIPLDLVAWNHLAAQGRDQDVRLVYDGYLYPFGHRASLVKVSERQVKAPDASTGETPVAYLRQRMFIIVREPERSLVGQPYANFGREIPFTDVRIETKTTPDIDPPIWIGTSSFWVDVGGGAYPFKVKATDLAGRPIDFLAPLIFVSLAETNPSAVQTAYAANDAQRRCVVKGLNIAFADPAAGDTELKTAALYFDTQPANGAWGPEPWVEPPFLPVLDHASVTVKAISQLLGKQVAVMVGFYQPYLKSGLDAFAGVFADIIDAPPAVQFLAEKSGGFATPNISLTALSARKGLVAGGADQAAAGQIKPSDYFGAVDAKLFGTIPLGNLIPLDPGQLTANAAQNAPTIKIELKPNKTAPTSAVAHIDWNPQLQSYSVDPVEIEFDSSSKLNLDVKITKAFDGSPASMLATGKLVKFKLSLLGVVALQMNAITFTSQNHDKTIVVADLDANNPIVFEGPLQFIQTLANILPPGLFGGEGPVIKATQKALEVSYTLGLPPITCGMFSLQNIAIMAGLDLPWLDGKPGFEFGFASRGKPFLVTVEIFGGGGFVHLLVDADGVQMVEGAIEFGGNFAFDIGVASGGVHAMAGIYFQLAGSNSDLTGFIDIGGEVSVLGIISISLDLNLSLSWIHNAQGDFIDGRASMTVSIHIIFFTASVSIAVEKKFKAGGGDPQVWQLMTADNWRERAEAYA